MDRDYNIKLIQENLNVIWNFEILSKLIQELFTWSFFLPQYFKEITKCIVNESTIVDEFDQKRCAITLLACVCTLRAPNEKNDREIKKNSIRLYNYCRHRKMFSVVIQVGLYLYTCMKQNHTIQLLALKKKVFMPYCERSILLHAMNLLYFSCRVLKSSDIGAQQPCCDT